jgi:thioredoxin 1
MNKDGLYVFSSKTCLPCKTLKRSLEAEGIEFTELDIAEHSDLANKHSVMSVPATFLIKHGRIMGSWIGGVSISKIKELL